MEKTYLQWNIANFITVLIMAAVGTAVFGAVSSFILRRMNGGNGKGNGGDA